MRTNGEGGQSRAGIAGKTLGKRVGGTTGAFPAFQLALSFSLSFLSLFKLRSAHFPPYRRGLETILLNGLLVGSSVGTRKLLHTPRRCFWIGIGR